MRQDLRRGRGQWRGCYSFKDIISREEPSSRKPTRNGGLNMGDTYYYYVSHFISFSTLRAIDRFLTSFTL